MQRMRSSRSLTKPIQLHLFPETFATGSNVSGGPLTISDQDGGFAITPLGNTVINLDALTITWRSSISLLAHSRCAFNPALALVPLAAWSARLGDSVLCMSEI